MHIAYSCLTTYSCATNARYNLEVFLWHGLAPMGMFYGMWLMVGVRLSTMLCKAIQPCSTHSFTPPPTPPHPSGSLWHSRTNHASLHSCFQINTLLTENVKEYWSIFFSHISSAFLFICQSTVVSIEWQFVVVTFLRQSPSQRHGSVFISWANTSNPGATAAVFPVNEILVLYLVYTGTEN